MHMYEDHSIPPALAPDLLRSIREHLYRARCAIDAVHFPAEWQALHEALIDLHELAAILDEVPDPEHRPADCATASHAAPAVLSW